VAAVADLPSSTSAATQFASANRALGVRQIGAFGDPGASFNIAINSTGKNLTGLSFKAQILDPQPRSTVWSIQVGVGLAPSTWETIGVFADPGAFGSTNVTFGEAALASMANQPLVWVRIVALTSSTGSGARDTFGIDDFVLNYEDEVAPLAWDSNGTTPGAGGPSPAGTWGLDAFWSASAAGDLATAAWVPGSKAAFSAGVDATGPFTVTLDGEQEARSVIIEEGTVTLTGGTLRLTGSAPRLQVLSESATIASLITGSAGFIKIGPGLLTLTNSNTFTGAVTLGAGTLEISSDAALGDSTNDVTLGGTLRITQSMTLGVDRNLSGAGTIQLLNAADLVIGGNVNAFGMGLVGPGSVAFSGATNGVGNFTLGSSVLLTGNALTLTNLTATAGSSTIANPLVFSPTVATVAVEAGGALRLAGAITMGNVAVTDRLIKTGEGTLELPVANPNLYKIALGLQGAVPVSGGLIKVGNKSALGTSLSFLNFGTLEFTQPLTGANALDIGFSISGREGSPIQLTGEDVTVSATNNIYGTVGTTGSVVVLKANNHTTFNGSFIVDPTTVVPVNTLKVGGTGSVTIASPSFPISLIVSETVSVEFNSDGIASSSSAASGLLVESGATLHPGTDGGARVVAVSKNFTLQSGGKVVFDITGSAAGQFDALNFVSSDAAITVDGSIEVRFGSGYAPQAGHQFQILQFLSGAAVDLADVTLSLPVLTAPLSWNTSLFATTGLLVIDGPGAGLVPVITFQPQSVLDAFASDFVSFAVTAVGAAPLSYQWLYYGQPINNATNRTLTLTASTANAGVYRVRVSNSHGSVISAPAFLVVNGLPVITEQPQKVIAAEGVSASFTFSSIGTVTGIQWQFNSGSGFANAVGEVSATLNRTAGAATYGSYRVVLTNDNGTVTSFAASLEAPYNGPPTSRPEWDYSGDLPSGQVGVVYAFTPGIKPDEPLNSIYRSADRFTATGLPTGLSINPTTGEISGTPVAVKATPYAVKITARNVTGTTVLFTRILINPLPTGALGVFTGPIQRSAILDSVITGNNGALGGQFDMVVTPTSVVSGKVTIGARAYSFRGVRATIPTAPLNRLSVAATIRVNATVNLTVSLLVDTLTGTILDTSTISDGTTTVAFKGWRNPWGTRAPAVQATALAGLYTTKLDLVDTALNSSQAPLGVGYLSFTVAPTTGRLTLSGRLSDGSAITMATFVGPAGQILLFRPLYAATVRGSVLGELGIAAEANPIDNTVEGDLTWTRPANAAASNRLYKAGFPAPGMLAVKVDGARYVAPTPRTASNLQAEPRVMGLTDAANEIEVLLTGAGIATAEPLQPNTKANVALNNRVTFSLDPLVNTRKMTLAFNAARGTFTGKVTLKQNNPLLEMAVPPLLVSVTRTVTYQGLIVKGEGAGYFILAQLPMIAGETPTKTAMESGKVEIKAVPVVP
jgi:autotransporter-associated beta strand protein